MVDTDSRIANIISTGDGESDLYLTFTYAWNIPEVEDGTAQAEETKEKFQQMAQGAVNTSIKQIREIVKGQA